MFDKFQEIYENRHQYALKWKERKGGKVLGYFCTYMPEEILYAASILPFRLLDIHANQDVSEPHLFNMFCPHCRDVLAQGLEGKYDYLDGIACANSCMHMLQAFESWAINVNPVYFRVDVPQSTQNPHCRHFLKVELECFKEDIERWIGKTISQEDLERAIEISNENRRLMRQIYELRKRDDPPLTGLEAMYMVVSSQLSDKAEHNLLLKEALEELKDRRLDRETGSRLMLLGSENDDSEFIKMIEWMLVLPATVVIDDHCTGSRYFWNEVLPEGDRLDALASRYIDRPPCPAKDWPERRRFSHILGLAKDWAVDGVIVIQQKFCDPHEMDIPALMNYLEENKMPSYFLELDVTVPVGQLQTRVEAVIEILAPDFV